MKTALMTSDNYLLQPITDQSLASFIGCALARDTLSPAKRVLYERIRSHMTGDALADCNAAYLDAVQS